MGHDDEEEDRPVRPRRGVPPPRDDDDREDDSPARPRRGDRWSGRYPHSDRGSSAQALWGIPKWGALGVGCVLALVALGANAIQAAALSGLACFLGIAARIFQAEEHRTADRGPE